MNPASSILEPADAVQLQFGGDSANAAPYLSEGWLGAEPDFRWTQGSSSVVRLPPLRHRPWFVLTLQCSPVEANGRAQVATIKLNAVELIRYSPTAGLPYAIPVPGELVRAGEENVLVLERSDAGSPASPADNNQEAHVLALAFVALALEPLDAPPYVAPRLLPLAEAPDSPAEVQAVAEAFQSLGLNCDVGMFQRHFGAEPFGLLRFAHIFPDCLVRGLQTRFAGVGDLAALSLQVRESGELHGVHATYGLHYHTFKYQHDTDADALVVKEAMRLDYLSRLFFEQLENNEKIFLRVENFERLGEALALHQLLQTYHPQARLLLIQAAPPTARERIGRVLELRPGLYRGYVSTLDDAARTPSRPLQEEWIRICTAVTRYESAAPPSRAARHDAARHDSRVVPAELFASIRG